MILKPLIPIYEKHAASDDLWPGYFADVRSRIPHNLNPEQFPKTMNFLNSRLQIELNARASKSRLRVSTLTRALSRSAAWMGREIEAAIARKPEPIPRSPQFAA